MTQVHTRSLKCKCRSWKHNLSLEVKRTNGCLWMPTKMLFYLELWPNAPQDLSHPTAFLVADQLGSGEMETICHVHVTCSLEANSMSEENGCCMNTAIWTGSHCCYCCCCKLQWQLFRQRLVLLLLNCTLMHNNLLQKVFYFYWNKRKALCHFPTWEWKIQNRIMMYLKV